MTKPRVLLLTAHYPPGRGGMAQSCDRIVHGLRRAGLTVDVVVFSDRAETSDTDEVGGRLLLRSSAAGPEDALRRLATELWTLRQRFGVP